MEQNESQSLSEMLDHYLATFWHWGWMLLLVTLLAAGAAYFASMITVPVYEASTLALVNPAPAVQTLDLGTLQTSRALAQTYVTLLKARPILEGVIDKLGLSVNPADLIENIQTEVVRNTQLIQIKVEDTDPVRAAQIANALIAEFSNQNMAEQASRYADYKQSLETQLTQIDQQIQKDSQALSDLGSDPSKQTEREQLNFNLTQNRQSYNYLLQSYEQLQLAETQSISTIVQKEPAIPPTKPIRPRTIFNIILATIVGLMVGAGCILLLDSLDDTLKGPDDISRQLGLSVLGIIASHRLDKYNLITISEPLSPISEAFRSLRTNLQFASVDRPLRSVMITSPSPGDGKSTVVGNLGVIMAQGGRHVVILDADLRRPMVHRVFHISNRTGLSGIFTKSVISLDDSMQNTEVANLHVITSGALPPNPSELLGSDKMTKILDELYQHSDFLLVDSPPLLAVTDTAVLAPKLDGILLVVKPGKSKLQASKQAVDQLRLVGANILGVILNEVEISRFKKRYDNYRGYYNYSYQMSDKKGRDKSFTSQKKVKQTKSMPSTPVD